MFKRFISEGVRMQGAFLNCQNLNLHYAVLDNNQQSEKLTFYSAIIQIEQIFVNPLEQVLYSSVCNIVKGFCKG